MDMEEVFLQAIQDNPSDWTPWLILADWFDEHNDPRRAELLRLQYALSQTATTERPRQEERLRELHAAGVHPCLPVRTNSLGMRLALIPPGAFLMGSPADEAERSGDEHQHEVEITQSFYASIYPVTQQQYQRVMGRNPSYFSATGIAKDKVEGMDTRSFPVENVSWKNAVAFCRRLSERPDEKTKGHLYRLPTEAEWEYACRGGPFFKKSSSPFYFGNSLSSTQANFDGNYPYGCAAKGQYLHRTTKVGSYPPNSLGLYDLHGNVGEWCADWYEAEYYQRSIRHDPQGPENGGRRVSRGGSWDCGGRFCRAAFRSSYAPGGRFLYFGFRVVLVAGERT